MSWKNVLVNVEDGVGWVTLNRPEKRNAMNPELNREMVEILDALETDERCRVLVLTGAGDSFSSGMDLKEYFRETDGKPAAVRDRVFRAAADWQWRRLRCYPKPTIAMVNGWCFGGGFTPLIACDLALAAEEAHFGLSEINWGIIPAGNVTKAIATVVTHRAALYYIMTGKVFDGTRAAALGLVNEAYPLSGLRAQTLSLAKELMDKNPVVLRHAKTAFKNIDVMDWDISDDYLRAKQDQVRFQDTERGRERGMQQFLDEKSYRPGLESYRRGE